MIRQAFQVVLGVVITLSACASPIIDAALLRNCSRQELVELLVSAQSYENREVESVTYIAYDEPPGGRRAAIVQYVPVELRKDLFEFAIARYYLRSWLQDLPLESEHKRVVAGHWYSSGVTFRVVRTRLTLSGKSVYVRIDDDLLPVDVQELLLAVENKAYSTEINCGSPRLDKLLKSVDRQVLYSIDVGSVDMISSETRSGRAQVSIWTTNHEVWEFEKRPDGYNLLCHSMYVI